MKVFAKTFVCCFMLASASMGFAIERPEQMGGFLKLEAGEYVYAEDHPSLDAEVLDNFTIEFWWKLEELPQLPFQQRVILAKPGSYALIVRVDGRLQDRKGFLLPYKSAHLVIIGMRERGGSNMGGIAVNTGEWHHLGFQTRMEGASSRHEIYVDGQKIRGGSSTPGDVWCADTDSRIYIGDVPRAAFEGPAEADFPYDPLVSSPISIDEVRLSNAPIDPPDIGNPPEAGPATMALWHFDEADDSLIYQDSSGFDNLLRRRQPVEQRR